MPAQVQRNAPKRLERKREPLPWKQPPDPYQGKAIVSQKEAFFRTKNLVTLSEKLGWRRRVDGKSRADGSHPLN
jgi:hypothetical protein